MPVCDSLHFAILDCEPIDNAKDRCHDRRNAAGRKHELSDYEQRRVPEKIEKNIDYERRGPKSKWKWDQHRMDWMTRDTGFGSHCKHSLRELDRSRNALILWPLETSDNLSSPGCLLRNRTSRSAAIFIGTVVDAQAHLSPDKTGVFSEFSFQVESILKNDPKRTVAAGETVSVERSGGRVRMPSGKIVVSWTNQQNMPKVGSRYVFFLTHDFETAGDTGDDFYLLTGYEFKNEKVNPLDSSLNQEVLAYKGATESSFLKDLFNALKSL